MKKNRKKAMPEESRDPGKGQAGKKLLRWCGKIVLIGASYKIYPFSVCSASGQDQALGPPRPEVSADRRAPDPTHPAATQDAFTLPGGEGPESVCSGCTSCTTCTGCTGCTSCTLSCTGCTFACTASCTFACTWACTASTGCTGCTSCTGCTGSTSAPLPPHVHRAGGKPFPDEGYAWVNDDPQDLRVRPLPAGTPHARLPHVVWTGDGEHFVAAPGWRFINDAPNDFRVAPLAAGTPHPTLPHVVWSGDGVNFRPAPGWRYISNEPNDFRVEPLPAPQGDQANPPVQRVAAVALLHDADLDSELARARRAAERMKGDPLADAKEIEAYARESQQAQGAAIKACLGEFVGALTGCLQNIVKQKPEFQENGTRVLLQAFTVWHGLTPATDDNTSSTGDRESRLQTARKALQAGYEFLTEADKSLHFANLGPAYAGIAKFRIDYWYESGRWTLFSQEVGLTLNDLGNPEARRKAQEAFDRYYKSLVDERKRRQNAKP